MDQGNKLPVMVANGDRIECVGKCMGLTLTVQNCPVQSNFYVLPVAACPIVLGVQWLETLGPIETDYRQLTMKFKLGDRLYQLQGIQRASISALEVSDLCGVEQVACFLLTTEVDTLCERESSLEELEQLLEEFQRVFDTPSGLPPPRGHDHTIPLLPNQPSAGEMDYHGVSRHLFCDFLPISAYDANLILVPHIPKLPSISLETMSITVLNMPSPTHQITANLEMAFTVENQNQNYDVGYDHIDVLAFHHENIDHDRKS
ncbi:hypothetical protein FEM48_Zijuj06G0210200 [Ziziphus jujuba var. spinosa]|uniref:Uncharacterized protein n=1 Tax=Ziziphus jujuba var. spinosa TaxID=714518 RepID=A0A978VBL4_ZIZJJ|nr:hypothetical protein FEM48_Zijuj06G0210200 [Ziziphus jujuba var. spinosa]